MIHDEDAVDPDGLNDIDVSRMLRGGYNNNDFTIGGSPEIQLRIRGILHEFRDIFSYNVKGKAMDVPPMTFTVDKVNWEARQIGYLHDIFPLRNTRH